VQPAEKAGPTVWILIGCGASVLVLAVALILVKRKK
jgi:hypothetical protein